MNKIVLAIIVSKDNKKVLVSKIAANHIEKFSGLKYVFPGGRVEKDETLVDALVREIKSETGYLVDPIGQISYWISPDTKEEVYSYHCTTDDLKKPLEIKNSNTESLHWFTLDELDEVYPHINPDVRKYLGHEMDRE
jgi:8-oxo-dGTP pyrophosphatase MutT (NUDIX family)